MTTEEKAEAFRILIALTMLRAGTVDDVMVPIPDVCRFPGLELGHTVIAIRLDGMAEIQHDMECDQCGRKLVRRDVALGKGVTTSFPGFTSSFFSPTCIACFSEDRGGYYSLAVAALVMKT